MAGQELWLWCERDGDVKFQFGQPPSDHCKAHSFVLIRMSPVWAAELQEGGFKESHERVITVEDVEPDTFKGLLRMVYTGDLNMESFRATLDVLLLADRYAVKNHFENILRKRLAESLTWGCEVADAVNAYFDLPDTSQYRNIIPTFLCDTFPEPKGETRQFMKGFSEAMDKLGDPSDQLQTARKKCFLLQLLQRHISIDRKDPVRNSRFATELLINGKAGKWGGVSCPGRTLVGIIGEFTSHHLELVWKEPSASHSTSSCPTCTRIFENYEAVVDYDPDGP